MFAITSLRSITSSFGQTVARCLPCRYCWSTLVCLAVTEAVCANGQLAFAEPACDTTQQVRRLRDPLARIVTVGKQHTQPIRTFVIVHGMGGMEANDRFYELAEAIQRVYPEADVYLVNWSAAASQRVYGISIPLLVAMSINEVAIDVTEQLLSLKVDPAQLTLIGESFGTYVSHQVAKRLNGVSRVLAFNPASELGGYPLPDLREYTEESWSFHTRSPFDTARRISDRGILLRTPTTSPLAQHTYGVRWLRQRLVTGDATWLDCERVIAEGPSQMFDLTVGIDGQPDWELAPRVPPRETFKRIEISNSTEKSAP